MTQIYVTLPEDFVATKWPGYFWHMTEKQLFSIKLGGVLRPLPARPFWCPKNPRHGELSYRISVKGFRRTVFVDDLMKTVAHESVVPRI